MNRPIIGEQMLCKPVPRGAYDTYEAGPVHTLSDYQAVLAIRAATFIAEQDCPYDEEYDGNDLCATHFLVRCDGYPLGTLRVRWFAEFAKLERVCMLREGRGKLALKVLLAEMFEHVSRKGYRLMVGQIQARLMPLWTNVFRCEARMDRDTMWFSDYEYVEVTFPLPAHPGAIREDMSAHMLNRPEGYWDQPGILEASAGRASANQAAE